MKIFSKIPKRVKRIAAFVAGAGLSFLAAGNLPFVEIDALKSVAFGASGAAIALSIALLLTYAGKGSVPDTDFDKIINAQIEAINAKTGGGDEDGDGIADRDEVEDTDPDLRD